MQRAGLIGGLLLIVLAVSPARAVDSQRVQEASFEARYKSACDVYEAARRRREANSPGAKDLFAQAALAFDALAEPGGSGGAVSSDPRLLRAAAFAALFAEDAGRAVLYFRRAAFVAPFDSSLRSGMERAQRLAGIESSRAASGRTSRVEMIASYLEVVPRPVRYGTLVVAWIGAWGLASWRFAAKRKQPSFKLVVGAFALATIAGATVAPLEYVVRTSGAAIIVLPETMRADPTDTPSAAPLATTLSVGTEVRVLARRGAWTSIVRGLDAAAEPGWVRSESVRRIFGHSSHDAANH